MSTDTRDRATGRTATVVAWVLAVLLALAMAMAGAAKLFGDPAMVELFDDIGSGQWLRYVVGTCEVAGALGLLVPRLRALAAVGLALLMLGAAVVNVAVLGVSPLFPLAYAVLAVAVLAMRRHELTHPPR